MMQIVIAHISRAIESPCLSTCGYSNLRLAHGLALYRQRKVTSQSTVPEHWSEQIRTCESLPQVPSWKFMVP